MLITRASADSSDAPELGRPGSTAATACPDATGTSAPAPTTNASSSLILRLPAIRFLSPYRPCRSAGPEPRCGRRARIRPGAGRNFRPTAGVAGPAVGKAMYRKD
ncbi:hypothetical protein Pa4123_47340 [Phytohabitans aurantiacus]|uniref:Uncharacterized protein n=1 Tax=Phytohabitans aurantiacus TaxID=3016789 RepID=A0ABQ5QY36_9ACTN|nr:hypothetical protein Pa4123_47340 [Phytohabitans aurantiacus]